MAFLEMRERSFRFTGTADLTLGVFPPGTVLWFFGARVAVGSSAGTMIITVDGATVMSDANLSPQVAGLKRTVTPGPYLLTGATNTLLADGTGITGSPDITFYYAVAKVEPGSGEV